MKKSFARTSHNILTYMGIFRGAEKTRKIMLHCKNINLVMTT